jgi:hypothetical protein
MQRILSIIRREGLQCLPCDRVNLDIERFAEYRDSDEHPAEIPFERPGLSTDKKKIVEVGQDVPSILSFFLDGSRRTYKVADVIPDGRYLPVIAGQVGVAVVKRCHNSHCVEPVREFCHLRNVIAFPDRIGLDDINHLQRQINKQSSSQFTLLRYEVKPERDPVDLGVAQIMRHMQDLEVEMIAALSRENLLQNESMLVVDGPLRFKEMKGRPFDIVQFRNVVGLSKTFRPSFTVGKGRGRKDVGAITAELDFGQRTSVFKTMEDRKTIGMWYLRIRPQRMMTNPLQGIVKIECYAVDPEDQESGLDAERIDVISGHILRERNVTPYGSDLRWASHIYPVYMAERYLKASFMSDICFQALF